MTLQTSHCRSMLYNLNPYKPCVRFEGYRKALQTQNVVSDHDFDHLPTEYT